MSIYVQIAAVGVLQKNHIIQTTGQFKFKQSMVIVFA